MAPPHRGGELPSRGRLLGIIACCAALLELGLWTSDLGVADQLMLVSTNAALMIVVSEVLRDGRA